MVTKFKYLKTKLWTHFSSSYVSHICITMSAVALKSNRRGVGSILKPKCKADSLNEDGVTELTYLSSVDYVINSEYSLDDTFQIATMTQDNVADTKTELTFNNSKVNKCFALIQRLKLRIFAAVVLVGYLTYVGFVLYLNPGDSALVCVVAVFILWLVLNTLTKGKLKHSLGRCSHRLRKRLKPSRQARIWIRRYCT